MTPIELLIERFDCVFIDQPTEKKMNEQKEGMKGLREIKRHLYGQHTASLKTFKKGGAMLTYIPWSEATKILDVATGGFWEYGIVGIYEFGTETVMHVQVTLHTTDGNFRYEGQGSEPSNVSGYGDAFSNAESMAYRRACAKMGLGLYLYKKP